MENQSNNEATYFNSNEIDLMQRELKRMQYQPPSPSSSFPTSSKRVMHFNSDDVKLILLQSEIQHDAHVAERGKKNKTF